MAQFSKKERLIATALSSMPRLKRILKKSYVSLNFLLYKSKVNHRILSDHCGNINILGSNGSGDETFFGYYDKSPENESGMILFNTTSLSSRHVPSSTFGIKICVASRSSGEVRDILETNSYNWQQGARAQWVDSTHFIVNVFENEQSAYRAILINAETGKIVRVFKRPIQDYSEKGYFLSINYERIMRLRPDYGYRNSQPIADSSMRELANDGIWKIETSTGAETIVHTLEEITAISPKGATSDAFHKVNHVMISPDGTRFIFIHRWYVQGKRYDRLFLSDFHNLSIVSDEEMVSHMCWINNDTLFGYLRHNGNAGFFFIDVNTLEFRDCKVLNELGLGDGHPSVYGDKIVIDSYPDKSGEQHLYLYDIGKDVVEELLEVQHSPKYFGECRCDLHPRFSPNGDRIYFDSVFSGKRTLSYIDLI